MKKEKTKSSLGRVLPLVLCLCLVLSMLPGMGTRVFAAGAGKAVGNGTTALSINVNTSGAQVVYYGGRPYYVIGYGASGVQTADSSDITTTLLAKNNFELTRFNPGGKNQYSGSLCNPKWMTSQRRCPNWKERAFRQERLRCGHTVVMAVVMA